MSAVIGSKWALSNDVKGKSFRRKIDASKEKSCQKEETLTTRESESRRRVSGLSRESFREVFCCALLCGAPDRARNGKGPPVRQSPDGVRMPSQSKPKSAKSEIIIPDKLYFRIGEVSTLCRLPAYVLRFWETEFPQLKPVKSSTGQRMYRRKDVDAVLRIKKLLYEKGFTIAGARQQLRLEATTVKNQVPLPFPVHSATDLRRLRHGLEEILTMLTARA